MKKFEINENDVKAAFDAAKTDEMKNVLKALFCKRTDAPSLDDHTTIHSYEDALEALGEKSPNLEEMEKAGVPKHIIALIKLETISRALWGRTFQPTSDAEGNNWYYYPWFALWTKEEIEDRKDEFLKKGALLSGIAFMVRLLVSVLCMRFIAPRMRLRTLGSACARKTKRKRNTLVRSLSSSGLSTWLSISL